MTGCITRPKTSMNDGYANKRRSTIVLTLIYARLSKTACVPWLHRVKLLQKAWQTCAGSRAKQPLRKTRHTCRQRMQSCRHSCKQACPHTYMQHDGFVRSLCHASTMCVSPKMQQWHEFETANFSNTKSAFKVVLNLLRLRAWLSRI